jgi:hypothetical protein
MSFRQVDVEIQPDGNRGDQGSDPYNIGIDQVNLGG